MLRLLNSKLHRLYSALRRRSKPSSVVIKHYPKSNYTQTHANGSTSEVVGSGYDTDRVTIRVATFNAALFSMAPPVSKPGPPPHSPGRIRPKSILKRSPCPKPTLRVSINLPENEISLLRNTRSRERPARRASGRSVSEVLRELNADILALQDVRADEENEMRPLSELAAALGMNYVFAESWAPQFGNAILSRWTIKKSDVQKLPDDSDFRNVLKATIEVPGAGDVNVYCTHLDHLDEDWRMKQISAIMESSGEPHLLAGGLNSLCETDYSAERWTDIVKFYQEMGKPWPKADVMRVLKSKKYVDAIDFAADCEPVVIVAKGQSVQGTCKYGTRVDYILASQSFPLEFVPGSYTVYSSQGASDHHIVKADLVKRKDATTSSGRAIQRVVRMCDPSSSRGLWSIPIK